MKIKNVLFVAAVCVLATLTSCGGSKKGGLPDFGDDEFAVATIGTSRLYLQVRLCSLLIARLIRLQFVQLLPQSILLRHRLTQLN